MAETFKQGIVFPSKNATAEDYVKSLQALNEKIGEIKKNITYLDVYNIIDTVEDKDTLKSKIAALVPNSSLVINDSFVLDNEEYIIGDIILKIASGKIIHIKGQPGGVFYPSMIEKNNGNYNIQYSYSSSSPVINSTSEASIDASATNAQTIKFTGLTPSESSNIYGKLCKLSELGNQLNNKDIKPYIKFYISDDGISFEEIIGDYTLSWDENILCWVVNFSNIEPTKSFYNLLWVKVK